MDNLEYLEHHGILGQKWGVRRYQNSDGTLTEAGRKRYTRLSKKQSKAEKKYKKAEKKVERYANRNYFLRDEGGFVRREMKAVRARSKYNKISEKILREYKDVPMSEIREINKERHSK